MLLLHMSPPLFRVFAPTCRGTGMRCGKTEKFSILPVLFYTGLRNTNQIGECKNIALGEACNGIGIEFFFQLLITDGEVKGRRRTLPDVATKERTRSYQYIPFTIKQCYSISAGPLLTTLEIIDSTS